jgi:hypothetical protein
LWFLSFALFLMALLAQGLIFWMRTDHYSVGWDLLFPAAGLVLLGLGWLLIRSFRGYLWYRLALAVLLFAAWPIQSHLVYNVGQSPYVQTYIRADRTFKSVETMRFFDTKKEIIVLADQERLNTEMVVVEDFRAALKVRLDPEASLAVLKAHLDSASVTTKDYPWVYFSAERFFENDLKRVLDNVQPRWTGKLRQIDDPGLSKKFVAEVRIGLEDRGWKFLEFDASRFKRYW